HQPELVITGNYHDTWPGGGWNSPDHKHTGRAVLDAVADAGNRWIFSELPEEPWSGVKYVAVAGSPISTHAIDVSSTMDQAVASLEAHKAYLEALGEHPMASARDFLEFLADMTAPRFGGRRASGFELVRF
ncbi:MAG TPA: PIG-L domain-containing protein, partial [Micromonosporaceae bacterium]|nr:PIG-L domain-containing protein [Micromonosporaceae bacterium]